MSTVTAHHCYSGVKKEEKYERETLTDDAAGRALHQESHKHWKANNILSSLFFSSDIVRSGLKAQSCYIRNLSNKEWKCFFTIFIFMSTSSMFWLAL